jgi:SAM-dependent methyltransferase
VGDAERLDELDLSFDGAISTFAGVNLIADMPRLAENLARAIRPGGRAILHGLNQWCFWYAAANRLRPRGERSERSGQLRVGSARIAHRLYDPFALWHAAFEKNFILREAYALSVIAAPALVNRLPRLVPVLFWIDRRVGRVAPAAGDFFVLDLERRE